MSPARSPQNKYYTNDNIAQPLSVHHNNINTQNNYRNDRNNNHIVTLGKYLNLHKMCIIIIVIL